MYNNIVFHADVTIQALNCAIKKFGSPSSYSQKCFKLPQGLIT